MTRHAPPFFGLLALAIFAASAHGGDSSASKSDSGSTAEKYTLRYQFQPGETVRWEVLQQSQMKTTISGTTKTAEMVSKSVKCWRVKDVSPDGTATFENLVESVDMCRKFSERDEVRYNSLTDKEAPLGFEDVAATIGVPLAVVTMDAHGQILHRERKPLKAAARNEEGLMTIPLPEEPVAVGHTWSLPCEIELPLGDTGTFKKVKTVQTFTLEGVKTGVATIRVATKILTPIHDPALEAMLIQKEQSGTVRFDVDAGRVLRQQMDLDRRVVGFTPNNPASSLHYVNRFTETLLEAEPKTAAQPDAPGAGAKE
jgi:hypothetical protein